MTQPSAKPSTSTLSTVYLDNQRVGLMGDPRPAVAKIVAAGGRSPESVQVARSPSPDEAGRPVRLDDVIDRTEDPTHAIYLTCRPKDAADKPSPASPRYISWPVPPPRAESRGPLPAQPQPVQPRPEPSPRDPQGADDPEWRV